MAKLNTSIDPVLYRPVVARVRYTLAEARAEYSRLRKIAAKRIKRLGEVYPQSMTYQRYKNAAQPLPRNASESTVYKALYDAAHFLSLQGSSVTGQRAGRKAAIERLHEQGYTGINESNFDAFDEFMRKYRQHYKSSSNDYSDQAVSLFNEAMEKSVDPDLLDDDLEEYIENGFPEALIPDNTVQEQQDLNDMRNNARSRESARTGEADETPEQPSKRRTRKTPAQKRAEKNARRAQAQKRNAKDRKRRKNRRK